MSCDTEKVEPLTWVEHQGFRLSGKSQFNSVVIDETLYSLGRSNLHSTSDPESAHTSVALFMYYDHNFKMPMGRELFLTANQSIVNFSNSNFSLRFRELDSSFIGFAFPNFIISEAMAVNDLNQFVIPYQTASGYSILWGQGAKQDGSLNEYRSTRWDTLKLLTIIALTPIQV